MRQIKPIMGWATVLLCLPFTCLSQDIQWEKSYGGKHAEYLFDAVPTADYGFILAGSSLSRKTGNKTSVNNGNLDYWIWKMDEKGEAVWQNIRKNKTAYSKHFTSPSYLDIYLLHYCTLS